MVVQSDAKSLGFLHVLIKPVHVLGIYGTCKPTPHWC